MLSVQFNTISFQAIMPQLTDLQRQVIVIFKSEHPTWGLGRCAEVLPNFFSEISRNQFTLVASRLKDDGEEKAMVRRRGSGTTKKFDSPVKQTVQRLAVTPEGSPTRGHHSQRQIAAQLNISKGAVFNILKESGLRCYRRIKCQGLTQHHKEQRETKAMAMVDRFEEEDEWKSVWFSDESSFMLRAPMNRQNERIYREVSVKTDIEEKDLLVEIDRQQPSIMCYGAVSWHGKTELRFIEGWAPDQGHLPPSRRKKKTVNQEVYRNEMCPLMFSDINRVMGDHSWTWQQDGAKAHTANETIAWLRRNTPDLILPSDWPSKSPDLNVMDFCVWSLLLSRLQSVRSEVTSIEMLKDVLTSAWNDIPIETIRSATSAWVSRLRRCVSAHGGHFEHL